MGSHVAGYKTSAPVLSYETMFNVASVGAFGYEFDITKASKDELDVIKKQVEFYKAHRAVMQYGDYYRLGESLNYGQNGGWITVSRDKTQAVAVLVSREIGKSERKPFFAFKGLNADYLYEVKSRSQKGVEKEISFTAYGDALCSYGLDIEKMIDKENDLAENSGVFACRIFTFKKIN